MKRKVALLLLILFLFVTISSCSSPSENTDSSKEPQSVATPEVLDIPEVTPIPSSTSQEPEGTLLSEADAESLWDQLTGYWTYGDSHFVVFAKDSGSLQFNSAVWHSEFSHDNGTIFSVYEIQDRVYHANLKFPAANGESSEWNTYIVIDLGPSGDNKISVQEENTEMTEFSWAGDTMDEALDFIES